MKSKVIFISALSFLFAGIALASSAVASPTCTLSVSPTPLEMLRPTIVQINWTSSGGDSALLKIDSFSQHNMYSNNATNGNVAVSIRPSLGTAVTLTVTRNNPYAVSTCNTQLPLFWIPK